MFNQCLGLEHVTDVADVNATMGVKRAMLEATVLITTTQSQSAFASKWSVW